MQSSGGEGFLGEEAEERKGASLLAESALVKKRDLLYRGGKKVSI